MDQRAYPSQVPEDRNTITDEAGGEGAAATARSVAARVTHMDASLESKLSGFLQWAGQIMLAALGVSPSEWNSGSGLDPVSVSGGQKCRLDPV